MRSGSSSVFEVQVDFKYPFAKGYKGENFIKSKIKNFQRRCEDDQISVEVTWFELNYWKPVKVAFLWRLKQRWWLMLETKCVGDNFELLVTILNATKLWLLRPSSQISHPTIVTNIGLSPISTGHQRCLTMKTRSKRSLSDDIEIPFVRMLMVFHNTDPELIIMQIAEKMIAKRLKNNFNDRVFDINTGTIVDHTATVTINFYKVRFRVRLTRTPVRRVSAKLYSTSMTQFFRLLTKTLTKPSTKCKSASLLKMNIFAIIQMHFKDWLHFEKWHTIYTLHFVGNFKMKSMTDIFGDMYSMSEYFDSEGFSNWY